jgi:hypothetical protein
MNITPESSRPSVKTPTKDHVANVEKLSFIITGRILEMSSLKDLNYKGYSAHVT